MLSSGLATALSAERRTTYLRMAVSAASDPASSAIATMPSIHQWLPVAETTSIVRTTCSRKNQRHLLVLAAMTAEIQQMVKDRKGSVQAPKQVIVADSLPLTGLGKPDKKALRAQFWTGDRAVG